MHAHLETVANAVLNEEGQWEVRKLLQGSDEDKGKAKLLVREALEDKYTRGKMDFHEASWCWFLLDLPTSEFPHKETGRRDGKLVH